MRDDHAHIEEVMITSPKIKATLKITKHISSSPSRSRRQ